MGTRSGGVADPSSRALDDVEDAVSRLLRDQAFRDRMKAIVASCLTAGSYRTEHGDYDFQHLSTTFDARCEAVSDCALSLAAEAVYPVLERRIRERILRDLLVGLPALVA